jgi:hypothetical protein
MLPTAAEQTGAVIVESRVRQSRNVFFLGGSGQRFEMILKQPLL